MKYSPNIRNIVITSIKDNWLYKIIFLSFPVLWLVKDYQAFENIKNSTYIAASIFIIGIILLPIIFTYIKNHTVVINSEMVVVKNKKDEFRLPWNEVDSLELSPTYYRLLKIKAKNGLEIYIPNIFSMQDSQKIITNIENNIKNV